ncbi:uncharacterized protein [Antedon mediterranea]|uniref:uncharacterized protein n=1 Tax=Antedon mediterranea TaxID=105859 RepID=UPI003AF81E66
MECTSTMDTSALEIASTLDADEENGYSHDDRDEGTQSSNGFSHENCNEEKQHSNIRNNDDHGKGTQRSNVHNNNDRDERKQLINGCNHDDRDAGRQHSNGWIFTRERKSMLDEISKLSAAKQDKVMKNKEPLTWRMEIQERIEQEIAQRVREALDTPPLERIRRNREKAKVRRLHQVQLANRSQSVTSVEELKAQKSKKRNKKKRQPYRRFATSTALRSSERTSDDEEINMNETSVNLKKQNWTNSTPVSSPEALSKIVLTRSSTDMKTLPGTTETPSENETIHSYTKKGFKSYVEHKKKNNKMKELLKEDNFNGVLMTKDGPFWPPEYTPVVPKPQHILELPKNYELLSNNVPQKARTVHNQRTRWFRPWDGSLMVYDSERSSRTSAILDVPEGCCSSLLFESRFESGNLRQAKRVGQFEYELLLKTDLYTNRHTQWYYFRLQHMVPGVTYKFSIINLLKRDSLYNHGMRPLLYSEKKATLKSIGWERSGHHISYRRNYTSRNPLLHPDMTYYVLEWQMEFDHEEDTCYLAHCYPFTFTDLKEHIDSIISDPVRGRYLQREVMCETRAGNSCYLLTISSSNGEEVEDKEKKGVVITARVHPGETNSSWIMKGVIDFLTSLDHDAQELRKNFIFKIVPMLNPDGVIVGNYRCSLAARDLNRNYRNPRKESFPTIWHTKQMLEAFSRQREVLVYCDLHGHSRKHNVFIYGCDSKGTQADPANFLCLRLFPWLMSRKAPDKFTFRGCKFQVRKCKESTGRVVMWRQLGIVNSFTLEATFCGSKNTAMSSSRHFNIRDFEELGREFGQVILQYHTAKNNQSLHSELILEMTRDITHQVLEGRGVMPVRLMNYCKGGKEQPEIGKESEAKDSNQNVVKKEDMEALILQITEETFEGCVGILQDLDALQEFAESDTSDSDSGSDSEMPASQLSGDGQTVTKSKSKKHSKNRAKTVPMLPALARSGNSKHKMKKSTKQNSNSVRTSNGFLKPKYPAFVNRYIGRSNGGIPMFTDERIGERSAKRMENVLTASSNGNMKGLTKEEEYARLVALTREIQIRTDETPFKLVDKPQFDVPPAGPVLIRQSYTHAGPGILRGPPAAVQNATKLSTNVSDKSDSIKVHNVLLNQQVPIENMNSDLSTVISSRGKHYNSSSDLSERVLRPNSFIGCSKGLRVASGGDVCSCFECQEAGIKTKSIKSLKDKSAYNNNLSSRLEDESRNSVWTTNSVGSSGYLQEDKDVLNKKYSVFNGHQSKLSSHTNRYVHGVSKEL